MLSGIALTEMFPPSSSVSKFEIIPSSSFVSLKLWKEIAVRYVVCLVDLFSHLSTRSKNFCLHMLEGKYIWKSSEWT